MSSFVKLSRKLLSSDCWIGESFSRGQAWVDLLLWANWKDNYVPIEGVPILIKRGQHLTSQTKLAARWKWSRAKVQRFLNGLKTMQRIEQQTSTQYTLITICNYDKYQTWAQDNEQQTRQQTKQRTSSKRAQTIIDNNIQEDIYTSGKQIDLIPESVKVDNSPDAPKRLKRVKEPLIERADNVWIADFEMAELSLEFGNNEELFFQIDAASKWSESNPRKFNLRKSHATIVKEFRDNKLAEGYRFFNHPKLGAKYYSLQQVVEFKKGNL